MCLVVSKKTSLYILSPKDTSLYLYIAPAVLRLLPTPLCMLSESRSFFWPPPKQPILAFEIYRDLSNIGMLFLEPRHELLVGAHLRSACERPPRYWKHTTVLNLKFGNVANRHKLG